MSDTIGRAVVEARTNIALVKYWGKRDAALNLPAVGSLSLTLDGLSTRTEVRFDPALPADVLYLDGEREEGKPLDRATRFVDLVRAMVRARARDPLGASAGLDSERRVFAEIRSANNFPTAAGLASSASGFAALALAATRAAGLSLDGAELSALARRGSGSAARSIFGGFVILHRGERSDGKDCVAEPLPRFDVRMVIAVAGEKKKQTLSTEGMTLTAETSPYYPAWIASHPADLAAAVDAVTRRDLEALGEVAERSCLTMHASALAARPGVIYWSGSTVEGFHAVRALRASGVGVWFTNDAGPHVKALCAPADAERVSTALSAVAGVTRTIVCAPGAAAQLVEAGP